MYDSSPCVYLKQKEKRKYPLPLIWDIQKNQESEKIQYIQEHVITSDGYIFPDCMIVKEKIFFQIVKRQWI